MQPKQSILKLRLLSWALVLLAVGGLLVVFLGQASISRRDVAAIALQANLEAEVGAARARLLMLQAAMRESLQAPDNATQKEALQKAEADFLKTLAALHFRCRDWPDLAVRIDAIEEQYRTRMPVLGAKVLELARRDTKAALDLFLSAYRPAGEMIAGLMAEVLDVSRRYQEQQLFRRANFDLLAASLTASLLLGMLALAFFQHRAATAVLGIHRSTKPAPTNQGNVVDGGTSAAAAEAAAQVADTPAALPETNLDTGLVEAPAPAVGSAAESAVPPLARAVQNLLKFGRTTVSAIWAGANRVGITIELDRASAEVIRPLLQNGGGSGAAAGSERAAHLRILLVQADEASRQLLRSIVEQRPGYEVVEASDGIQATKAIEREETIDLCITDIKMPHLDGFDLLRSFRADPRFRTLDVILCTVANEEFDLHKAEELRVTDYLEKPFEASKVWAVIHAVEGKLGQQAGSKAHAAERMGIDVESYTALIGTLTEEIAETAAAIRVDLVQGNRHSALTRANALLGACMNLGDDTLMRLTKKVEEALEKGTVEEIMPELELLESENNRVKALALHLANRMGAQSGEGKAALPH